MKALHTPRCRRRPRRLVAGALACLLGAAAAAPANDRCLDAADEAALLACRKAGLAEVDTRLRQAMDQLRQRYQDDEPERAKLLSAAQQAWRNYQKAECRFRHHESRPGAAYPAYLMSCLTDLAERRLQDLQAILAKP